MRFDHLDYEQFKKETSIFFIFDLNYFDSHNRNTTLVERQKEIFI